MLKFPLYDELLERANNMGSNDHIDIDKVCRTINSIQKNLSKNDTDYHYCMIGYIIIHHKSITEKTEINVIPYNCQIMMGNRGLLNTMENLPFLLQKIISQYVEKFSIK
jgi:hypothetical protein